MNFFERLTKNRRVIKASMPAMTATAASGKQLFAAVIKFKRFSSFRNRIGYANANGLLHALSKRLLDFPDASLGRLGRTSVEFVFTAKDQEKAEQLVNDLFPKLQERVSYRGIEYEPQPVVGLCEVINTALSDFHFDRADKAISIAFRSNLNMHFANGAMVMEDRQDALELLQDLQHAIEQNELTLAYMPKLNLRTGEIEAAECLCRWEHPIRGHISPEEFIAMADESGMIEQLTLYIAKKIIADQKSLAAKGIDIQLDLNLSAGLISDIAFCDKLVDLFKEASGRIGVEITETAVIEQPDIAIENLERLVKAGFWLAIDDYGSGLSSLSYLRRIPAHELKVDKSFVTGITKSNRDPLLVRSSIELAHSLEMLITAEGVEDEMTLSLLQVMGCDAIQGYWLSRALPIEEFVLFFKNFAAENPMNNRNIGTAKQFGLA